MIIWGVSAGFHDAALTVISDDKIVFAAHSERYSRIKNDKKLNINLIIDALRLGDPDVICWYENPILKATRRWKAGQDNIWKNPKSHFTEIGYDPQCPIKWGNHHRSHMAAGYYTRPFDNAATLVVDAIGEWTTISIWNNTKKIWTKNYPDSLGLFYSAFTDRVGLTPNEDEYILMGMAAYGNPDRFFNEINDVYLEEKNLHRGVRWWRTDLTKEDYFDVAAATQKVFETHLKSLLCLTKELTKQNNLIFMGGCALNCLANRIIPEYFDKHWIMPNPGDAGSSLGAALAYLEKRISFTTPYLGYDIKGEYPIQKALESLERGEIFGIANGKAEFGPRALGNRSLMADPRGNEIKDKVNAIKQRQKFRPFAPVILEEFVHEYFEMPNNTVSPYMQFVAKCKHPDKFPAIIHADGTSRVQTVNYEQHPHLHTLLSEFYRKTGCPMLLNTSLNIKGQPIVNNEHDAEMFARHYKVPVHTKDHERLINFIV